MKYNCQSLIGSISQRTDVNKTNESRKCIFLNHYYFLKVTFRFQSKVCDSCHDFMQKAVSFNDAAIAFVKGNDYRTHFWYMSKDEVINILNDANLNIEICKNLLIF